MKRLPILFLLLALLLTGCQTAPIPDDSPSPLDSESPSQPLRPAEAETAVTIPKTPSTASFFLTRWDGETLLEQFCYTQEDIDALAQALPAVQGITLTDWTAPEAPWPIYGLRIGGVEEDFEAAYCGGVWLDSEGHVLEADVDFPALWEQFAQSPESRTAPIPAVRELALSSGVWDPRFLTEAKGENLTDLVPIELTVSESGVNWTIENRTGVEIVTGNRSTAVPQVCLDGVWYNLPTLSGKHYAWTSEACSTPPDETFSGALWAEAYGPLPDGNYRLVLSWSSDAHPAGAWTAAPFRVWKSAFASALAES